MVGRKQTRRYAAGMMGVFLAGCVGLGDMPPRGVDSTPARSRPQPVAQKPTPDLRIASDTVAQGPDIPLVPVPPLPRQTPSSPTTPARPVSPPFVPSANPPMPPVTATPPAVAPQATPPAETPPRTARQLLQQAAVRCSSLDSYIVRLTRREHLKDKAQPEEILKFTFRKNPFS